MPQDFEKMLKEIKQYVSPETHKYIRKAGKIDVSKVGVPYTSDEYHKAMDEAEKEFSKIFCKLDFKKPFDEKCLEKTMSDGFTTIEGKEAGVGLYCLGACEGFTEDVDNIEITIVTDGTKAGWTYHHEPYAKALTPERLFMDKSGE